MQMIGSKRWREKSQENECCLLLQNMFDLSLHHHSAVPRVIHLQPGVRKRNFVHMVFQIQSQVESL